MLFENNGFRSGNDAIFQQSGSTAMCVQSAPSIGLVDFDFMILKKSKSTKPIDGADCPHIAVLPNAIKITALPVHKIR